MPDSIILPCFLFPNIGWWKIAKQQSVLALETQENWVKQSARNHFEIVGSNGRLKLSIPTVKNTRLKMDEVEIDYREPWQKLHLRSLDSCYNHSPFYEYYREELRDLFLQSDPYLLDMSRKSIDWCMQKLQMIFVAAPTSSYKEATGFDFRKEMPFTSGRPYPQVFEDRLGFESNLSVLDLLFNVGPASGSFI